MDTNTDVKHGKYFSSFKPNEIFFGLGIENETYFVVGTRKVTGREIINNRKRERYSVDYYVNFKDDELNNVFSNIDENHIYNVPIFMNSYAMKNCDKNGNPKTLYDKAMTPNVKFSGQTLEDFLIEQNDVLKSMYKKKFEYDGDAIEFITQNFYKTTVSDCINELIETKKITLDEFNKVFKENNIYSTLSYPEYNFGFAKYTTNMNNVSICNNSTYHINITLPTLLDNNCEIKNMNKFIKNHKRAIKYIQWLEPLIIACYGSADIFSLYSDKFSKGSQRNALSRYISIGTYNSESMIQGRLLNNFDHTIGKNWYSDYHQQSGYVPPSTIGYDINFKNFRNHGIEIRFFDYFPEKYLADVINLIILVCELSLDKQNCSNARVGVPTRTPFWHNQTKLCIKDGSQANLDIEYTNYLAKLFNINHVKVRSCQELLQTIADSLYNKYAKYKFSSAISPNMIKPYIANYNAQSIEYHKQFLGQFLEKTEINNTILQEIELDDNFIDVNAEFDELSDLSEYTQNEVVKPTAHTQKPESYNQQRKRKQVLKQKQKQRKEQARRQNKLKQRKFKKH